MRLLRSDPVNPLFSAKPASRHLSPFVVAMFLCLILLGWALGCRPIENAQPESQVKTGAGGIAAQIILPPGLRGGSGAATNAITMSGLSVIRGIVSGSGISPSIQQDFAATITSGSIGGVPAGTNRTPYWRRLAPTD